MLADDESSPLIAPIGRSRNVENSRNNAVRKYAAIVATVAAVGLLGVSISGVTTPSNNSQKKIQMTITGTIKYSTLSDNEQADLFEYYKKSFGREVGH
jgi:hypothetical protein